MEMPRPPDRPPPGADHPRRRRRHPARAPLGRRRAPLRVARERARDALRLHAQARGHRGLVVGQGDIRRARARRAQLEQEIGHALGARADLKLLDLALAGAARAHGTDHQSGKAFDESAALGYSQAALGRALGDYRLRERTGPVSMKRPSAPASGPGSPSISGPRTPGCTRICDDAGRFAFPASYHWKARSKSDRTFVPSPP